MKKILNAILLGVGLVISTVAVAQENCGPTNAVTDFLTKKYEETPILMAAGERGSFISVWTNKDTGTMTVVIVSPNRTVSCMLASGEGTIFLDQDEKEFPKKTPQSDKIPSKGLPKIKAQI